MGLFVLPNAWVLLETDNSHQLCGSEFVGMKPKENIGHDFLQWVAEQLLICSAATIETWFLFADE